MTRPIMEYRGSAGAIAFGGLCLALIAAASGCAAEPGEPEEAMSSTSAELVRPRLQVGVRAQSEYQSYWSETLPNAWNNAHGFGSQISSTDDWIYYYNLIGAKPSLEETGDAWGTAYGSADTVDLFFTETHGGNWGSDAVLAMWDSWSVASSTAMRLGDDSRQLSVLAALSCDILSNSDGNFWGRWYNAFAGGLRLVTSGHGSLYDVAGIGAGFATRLQWGWTIGDAFANATLSAYGPSKPAVAAAATDANSCWGRLGMSMDNVLYQSRVRDGAIGYMCWVTWN